MTRFSRSYSTTDDMASAAMGGLVLLAVFLILLLAYVAFRAAWLVVRVTVRHPAHRVLRLAWGCFVGGWALVALVAALGGYTPLLDVCLLLAGLATAALVLIAKLIELDATSLVQTERTKDILIQDVLFRPWWDAA